MVGPGQDGGQAGGRIVVVQGVQAEVVQLAGEAGQRDVGMGVGTSGDQAQREGIAAAELDQFGDRVAFGRHPLRTDSGGEQRLGIVGGERCEAQVLGAVPADQRRQCAAAGHHHRACLPTRQQRDDLVGRGGIVQHDQHLPPGYQTSVQPSLGVRIGRDPACVEPQGIEEPPHRDRRIHRLAVGTEAPHIDAYGVAKDGRLFRSERGGVVASTALSDVWAAARPLALTPDQVASPLAGRPYDLRHAAVSLWLNGGVSPPDMAERAGHGVDVLLRVYAKCLGGGEEVANKRREATLNAA